MKTKTKNVIVFILIFLFSIFVAFMPKMLKNFQKSKNIPIDVSYKKFEEYKGKLKIFAKENNFEFSSHGDCDDESCYKTILLDSNNDFNMDFEFMNSHGEESCEISISSNKSKVDLFSIIEYDIVDKVLEIVFNKSYKDKLKEMSGELSNVNSDGEGKTMYLDKKEDITIEYYLYYFYKPNTGIRTEDYLSVLMIKQ